MAHIKIEELKAAKVARFDFRHLLRHNCNAGLYTHIKNKRMFTKTVSNILKQG